MSSRAVLFSWMHWHAIVQIVDFQNNRKWYVAERVDIIVLLSRQFLSETSDFGWFSGKKKKKEWKETLSYSVMPSFYCNGFLFCLLLPLDPCDLCVWVVGGGSGLDPGRVASERLIAWNLSYLSYVGQSESESSLSFSLFFFFGSFTSP